MTCTLREFFDNTNQGVTRDIVQAFYNEDSLYLGFKDSGAFEFDSALTDKINEATARFYQLTA